MTKKIFMVIAQEGFRDEELLEPKEILENEGFEVITASPKGGFCQGMKGLHFKADIAIKDIDLDNSTVALTLVGGINSPSLLDVSELKEKLVEAIKKKLVIGAICLSPMVLAGFGLINDMSATVYPTDESLDMLKNNNVLYIPENVVVDEWLVTGNGPSSATAYGEALVELLKSRH